MNKELMENIFEETSFDWCRTQSSSLYLSRPKTFDNFEGFSQYESSPSIKNTNRLLSPSFSSGKQREVIESKQRVDNEQSLPGSTDVDSDEESFESHFDAIDELSEIFETASNSTSQPTSNRNIPFSRPSNPIVKDTQFGIPRCSAPVPVLPEVNADARRAGHQYRFSCRSSSFKEELEMANYIKPSSPNVRPKAAINNLFTSKPLSLPSAFARDF